MPERKQGSISLLGGISIGTGVMIGAGVFALMGQVAEAAGPWFPAAFAAAAVVAGVTGYSYARLAAAFPSSGGIGRFLNEAYGRGTIAAGFTVAMYLSMVLNESLVARTFGTYVLRLFGADADPLLVPVLGVALLVVAFAVNAASNTVIERSENAMTAVKAVGLLVFGAACLAVADFPASGATAPAGSWDGLLGGIALAILAYKGFTTITTTGDEIEDPVRNVGRAIGISIVSVTVIYLLVALAVRGNLGLGEIVAARDYALAEAARPVFGGVGFGLTAGLAAFAAVSSVLASVFATSRILAMLADEGEVPELRIGAARRLGPPPLVVTVAFAILLTVLFDLGRVAALGAFAYLSLDGVIHWGHLRRLRGETGANPVMLVAAVGLDAVVGAGFIAYKLATDPFIVFLAVGAFVVIGAAQYLFLRRVEPASR
jgi:amino acid transporter